MRLIQLLLELIFDINKDNSDLLRANEFLWYNFFETEKGIRAGYD